MLRHFAVTHLIRVILPLLLTHATSATAGSAISTAQTFASLYRPDLTALHFMAIKSQASVDADASALSPRCATKRRRSKPGVRTRATGSTAQRMRCPSERQTLPLETEVLYPRHRKKLRTSSDRTRKNQSGAKPLIEQFP